MNQIIGVAGDWHGNTTVGRAAFAKFKDAGVDIVFHLGDFGIWSGPSGTQFISAMEDACVESDILMYVVPGNHEDWSMINRLPRVDPGTDRLGRPLRLTDHIRVLRRGFRFKLGTRGFVALGGAPSIDYQWRIKGREWWPEEAIQPQDVEHVARGGGADVMLAHDAPGHPFMTPMTAAIVDNNPMGWDQKAVAYAESGRSLMTTAYEAVKPTLFLHGHYHVRDSADVAFPDGTTGRIEALAADGQPGNLALLDLRTLAVTDLVSDSTIGLQ